MKISNKLEISAYLHCAKCIKEKPSDISAQDYRQYDVGWTENGLQVWCVRHDCNIVHIDFEGHKHPADTTAAEKQKLEIVK